MRGNGIAAVLSSGGGYVSCWREVHHVAGLVARGGELLTVLDWKRQSLCAYNRGLFCADTLGIASSQVCSAMLNNAVDASCLATPGGVTTISENQVRYTLPISLVR